MAKLIGRYNVGDKRKISTEYNKLAMRVKYLRKTDRKGTPEYKTLMKQLVKIPSTRKDNSFVRIFYLRYADDFIVGVEGSAR